MSHDFNQKVPAMKFFPFLIDSSLREVRKISTGWVCDICIYLSFNEFRIVVTYICIKNKQQKKKNSVDNKKLSFSEIIKLVLYFKYFGKAFSCLHILMHFLNNYAIA